MFDDMASHQHYVHTVLDLVVDEAEVDIVLYEVDHKTALFADDGSSTSLSQHELYSEQPKIDAYS
jgi:hypothetical protein